MSESICGVRFNAQGVVVPETQKQATWAQAVEAERAARRPQVQADDPAGLAERAWSQR